MGKIIYVFGAIKTDREGRVPSLLGPRDGGDTATDMDKRRDTVQILRRVDSGTNRNRNAREPSCGEYQETGRGRGQLPELITEVEFGIGDEGLGREEAL